MVGSTDWQGKLIGGVVGGIILLGLLAYGKQIYLYKTIDTQLDKLLYRPHLSYMHFNILLRHHVKYENLELKIYILEM